MRICGIELKSNEARIVVIENTKIENTLIETAIKKITLQKDDNQAAILSFKDTILNFFKNYDIEKIGIKQRAQTGPRSGGGKSFKMEAIIQLYDKNVSIINANTIKSKTKNADLSKFSINNYQQEALKTALSLI